MERSQSQGEDVAIQLLAARIRTGQISGALVSRAANLGHPVALAVCGRGCVPRRREIDYLQAYLWALPTATTADGILARAILDVARRLGWPSPMTDGTPIQQVSAYSALDPAADPGVAAMGDLQSRYHVWAAAWTLTRPTTDVWRQRAWTLRDLFLAVGRAPIPGTTRTSTRRSVMLRRGRLWLRSVVFPLVAEALMDPTMPGHGGMYRPVDHTSYLRVLASQIEASTVTFPLVVHRDIGQPYPQVGRP